VATLIVGGTGSIGSYVALELERRGADVTLAARHRPDPASPIGGFATLIGDFARGDFTADDLAPFDTILFAAANDVRQLPRDLSPGERDAHLLRVNGEALPAFVARAREAGVSHCIYVGSYYPQAMPALIERSEYIRSRWLADTRIRALATDSFRVVSVNAPIITGGAPGLLREKHRDLAMMALGLRPDIRVFAPEGGSNFMSIRSLCQAILGALEKGENGRGYLVGDENLLFADYLRYFFEAAGRDVDFPVEGRAHPVLGGSRLPADVPPVFYDPEGAAELGYDLGNIRAAAENIVAIVRAEIERGGNG